MEKWRSKRKLGELESRHLQGLREQAQAVSESKEEVLYWEVVFATSLVNFYERASDHLWGVLSDEEDDGAEYDWFQLGGDDLRNLEVEYHWAFIAGARALAFKLLDELELSLGVDSSDMDSLLEYRNELEKRIRSISDGAGGVLDSAPPWTKHSG